MTEDDTFRKLKKASFEKLWGEAKAKRPWEDGEWEDHLKENGWTYGEWTEALWMHVYRNA